MTEENLKPVINILYHWKDNEKYSLIITGQIFCVHRLISYSNLNSIYFQMRDILQADAVPMHRKKRELRYR